MKKFLKNTTLTVLSAALFTSAFAGIGADNIEAARKGFDKKKIGGKVTYSSFSDAIRLTPNTIADATSNRIVGMVFDTLLSTDMGGSPIPSVGTSWKVSDDRLTYTIKLRKDVKFHDGKPLTADDVVFSYEMYIHPKSINPYRTSTYKEIDRVEKVDQHTVRFHMKQADVFALYSLMAPIMPKHVYKDIDTYNNDVQLMRKPVGSGPFIFKEWKTAERIVVKANKKYWAGRPYMNEVIMKILPDQNVEVINILKGTINFLEDVQPKAIREVSKNKKLKVLKYDRATIFYMGLNQDGKFFADERVRQAVALGLNRQAIVDRILLKNGTIATGAIHPKQGVYNKKIKPFPFDQKKAKDLLEDAGWKPGKDGILEKNGQKFELELPYNAGNKIRESIALLAQQDWGKLGIKVTPRTYEWSTYLNKVDKGDFEAWLLGWNLGTAVDHFGLFHSSNIPTSSKPGNNTSRVRDPRVDKILEDYKKEFSADKRKQMYAEYQEIAYDKQFNLFLYYPKSTAAMHKDLAGVKFSLWSRFYNVEDWYWKNPSMRKKK